MSDARLEILNRGPSKLAPILIALVLGLAGGSVAPAFGQTHDHEPNESSIERPSEELVGGVPRAFLERPIPLNDELVRIPHQVAAVSEGALAYYQQGLSYFYLYHRLNAIRSFNHALRLDPTFLPAYAALSRALAAHGARSESEEVVRQGKELMEELGGSADVMGRLLLELRAQALGASSDEDREEYRQALSRAVEENSDDIELRMLYALNSRGEERRDRLQDVVERVPNHPGAHHQLIHYHEVRRETEKAVEHGAILAELAPTVAHGRHMYGHNLMRVGRVEEAMHQFAVADSLEREYFAQEEIPEAYDWHHPHNLHLLALTLWYLGRTADAEAVLRRRAALRDREGRDRPMFLVQLGEFLLAEGRAVDALVVTRQLLDTEGPNGGASRLHARGHLLEAEARLLRGELEEARSAVAAAGEMGGGRGQARVDLQIRLHAGSEAAADEELEEILTDLRQDRGPDGWITSLLHMHALAQSARAAGAQMAAERISQAMEEHDPSFQPRVSLYETQDAPGQFLHHDAPASEGNATLAKVLHTHPVEATVRVDGELSELAWTEAQVASGFIQKVPEPGQPASKDTEARIFG